MKSLGLILVTILLLMMFVMPFTNVRAQGLSREYIGKSPGFGADVVWWLSVDLCQPGDIIRWHWTTPDNLTFKLVNTPSMTWYLNLSNDDGFAVVGSGYYALWWHNNNMTHGDEANVTFDVLVYTPELTIKSPVYLQSFNTQRISLSGTFDGYGKGVLVGLDDDHMREATISKWTWSIDDFMLNEGTNTIIVRSYYWLDPLGRENLTIDRTVQVISDTSVPSAEINVPLSGSQLKGNDVTILWNCSDSTGIRRVDLKVDGHDWYTVHYGETWGQGYERLRLSDGEHTVQVRVTDLGGNQATASSTFTINSNAFGFAGPYYGLPFVGIIVGVLVAAIYAFLTIRKQTSVPSTEDPPPPKEQ